MVKPRITLDLYYIIVLALGAYLLFLVVDRLILRRKEFLEVNNGEETNQAGEMAGDSMIEDAMATDAMAGDGVTEDVMAGNNGNGNGDSDIMAGPNGPMPATEMNNVAKSNGKAVEGSCECRIKQAMKGHLCYTSRKLRKYAEQNALLKHYIDRLLKQSDEPANYNLAYRKRLSNKYYPVKPALAYTDHAVLNLRDEDFSTKTFSEAKFLAPTKKSSYYGKDTHYGSYLCDDMYPYNDPNVLDNQQLEFTPQVRLY
jgi:hypothetical protein